MVAKIPVARLVVIPAAGHAVNIDQPQAFIDAVLPFLNGLETRKRQKAGVLKPFSEDTVLTALHLHEQVLAAEKHIFFQMRQPVLTEGWWRKYKSSLFVK